MVGRKVGRSESGSGMLTVLVSTFRPSQRSERQRRSVSIPIRVGLQGCRRLKEDDVLRISLFNFQRWEVHILAWTIIGLLSVDTARSIEGWDAYA